MDEIPDNDLTLQPESAEEKPESEPVLQPEPAEEKPEEEAAAQPEPAEEKPEEEPAAQPESVEEKPEEEAAAQPEPAEEKTEEESAAQPEPDEEKPEESLPAESVTDAGNPPEADKKAAGGKKKKIAIAACAAAIAIGLIVFLALYFSTGARFDRAMEKEDYAAAEEIIISHKLKASEKNDAHFGTLADMYLENYMLGSEEYEAAVQKLLDLKSAEFFDEQTGQKVEDCEKIVLEDHLNDILKTYDNKQNDYDDTIKLIDESNAFDDDIVKEYADRFIVKTDEKREDLYADAIRMIKENDKTDDIISALEPFGDFRNAQALGAIFKDIKDKKGLEAANLLIKYRDSLDDENDAVEKDAYVFSNTREMILDRCFESVSSVSGYDKKLDAQIRYNYVAKLLDYTQSSSQAELFGSSSNTLSLGKKLDHDWFKSCKGGTGKILYVSRFLNSTWSDERLEYYYWKYENADVPLSQMPESLEDVEYIVFYDEGGSFYNTYSSDDGDQLSMYRRADHVKVRQYPSGKTIYDSGEIKGPTPADTISASTGTKYAYGDHADLSNVKAKVKKTIGLK